MASVLPRTDQRDREYRELLDDIRRGTGDLADALGMPGDSILEQQAHKRLVDQVQRLAVMDAKLEMKVAATTRAIKTLTAEMGSTDVAEVESMAIILEQLKDKVSSDMHGAEGKAIQTKRYKDLMKKIVTSQDDEDDIVMTSSDSVSLICPITAVTIVDPVRSKICKHTYGRVAIRSHIRVSKGAAASCPVAGCLQKVSNADLEPDKDMQRRLRIEKQSKPNEQDQRDDAEEADDETIGETEI